MDFIVPPFIKYADFASFIDEEKGLFNKEKGLLFERFDISKRDCPLDVELYDKFRKLYRLLVNSTINDVIAHYRKYLPKECLIYLFGSYTKHTDRIRSDIDLTFVYDEKKTPEYECIEEMIDYTLSRVFDFSIDHVHGKFQHYPCMRDFDTWGEDKNLYRLVFEDRVIEYRCGPETLAENLMNIKNVRDYRSLIEGYAEKYALNSNIDCLYSIEILENTLGVSFLDDLARLEDEHDICRGYTFEKGDKRPMDTLSASVLKKLMKGCVVEFYTFVASLRKRFSFHDDYSMNMEDVWSSQELRRHFSDAYINKLRADFITFMFSWNRLEMTLERRGIALSTRCYREFSLQELDSWLYEDWGKGFTHARIYASRNTMIEMINKGLETLK